MFKICLHVHLNITKCYCFILLSETTELHLANCCDRFRFGHGLWLLCGAMKAQESCNRMIYSEIS